MHLPNFKQETAGIASNCGKPLNLLYKLPRLLLQNYIKFYIYCCYGEIYSLQIMQSKLN
jgi:hypothetical protein